MMTTLNKLGCCLGVHCWRYPTDIDRSLPLDLVASDGATRDDHMAAFVHAVQHVTRANHAQCQHCKNRRSRRAKWRDLPALDAREVRGLTGHGAEDREGGPKANREMDSEGARIPDPRALGAARPDRS